jgi:hypothetical protein
MTNLKNAVSSIIYRPPYPIIRWGVFNKALWIIAKNFVLSCTKRDLFDIFMRVYFAYPFDKMQKARKTLQIQDSWRCIISVIGRILSNMFYVNVKKELQKM